MSIKKSLLWMAIAQGFSFALQFSSSLVVARYLSPHEAGIYAAALSILSLLSMAQTLGLPALIIREQALTPQLSGSAFTINAFVSVLLSCAILGIAQAGESLLGDAGVRHALLGLAPLPLFGIISFLPAAMMEREGEFKSIALIGTLGAIAGATVIILAAVAGASYMSIVYGQWANTGVVTAVMAFVGRRHGRVRPSLTAWRRVADFALQMIAVSGINNLSTRASDIILGRIAGLPALGYFNRSSALNGLLWTNIHLFIGRVMLVDYAELYREGKSLRERYLRTVEMITALLWPLFLGLAVLARVIVELLFGANWVFTATPLALLAFASAIQVAITMTWELFAATDRMRDQTRVEVIRSIVALSSFTAGCFISMNAAAAARILDAVFALILYRPYLNSMTDTRFRDFIPVYGRAALLSLLAVGPALVLVCQYPAFNPPLLLAAGTACLGILLWAVALAAMRHPLFMEIRSRRDRIATI